MVILGLSTSVCTSVSSSDGRIGTDVALVVIVENVLDLNGLVQHDFVQRQRHRQADVVARVGQLVLAGLRPTVLSGLRAAKSPGRSATSV